MLSYTKLISHPNKELETHLKNVGEFSKIIFNSLNINIDSNLEEISFLIGITHDFAKSTSFFQNYIRDHKKNKYTAHSLLSAIFTYYVIDNYIKTNNIKSNQNLAILSFIVVLKHHGNLENIENLFIKIKESNDKLLKQLNDLKNNDITLDKFYKKYNIDLNYFLDNYNDILEKISSDLLNLEIQKNIDNYDLILLLFSVLIDSDKMDASQTNFIDRKDIDPNIVDKFKKNNFINNKGPINKIREESYKEVIENISKLDLKENKILTINLPTGIGKTLTGFSAALKLKKRITDELNFNPRIIYSLPFLSIIDQNESILKKVFNEENLNGSDYILKHNSLSDLKYSSSEDEEYYDINKSKLLVEGWNSEIIVTTFVQFFNSIFGNRNSAIRKFHNITNSIILLDEIQSIPYKYWSIINLFLKRLTEKYNCWIILMTATQPMIFDKQESHSLIDAPEYYFNQFNRIEYNFDLEDKNINEFKNEILNVIEENPKKDILIILNTIKSSKIIYNHLKEHYENYNNSYINKNNGIFEIDENNQLIYLSTDIIPKDRLNRINYINNSENSKRKIIISTQLIEAGVDIDMDIIYRDLAPLDSIIQCAGRCNRNNNKEMGKVNVISLTNDNDKVYSNFIYENLLLSNTKDILKNENNIQEKNFNLKTSENYFNNIKKRGAQEDLESYLTTLKFNDISTNFKLIENDFEKVDVFVCVDDHATKVFNNFLDIRDNFKGFERKNKFLEIKNEFYNYVISVSQKRIGATNKVDNEELFVIYQDELERKYKRDTGFLEDEKEEAFIL